MVFPRSKQIYMQVVRSFLEGQLPVDDFIRDYMRQWRKDRDAQWKALNGAPMVKFSTGDFGEAVDRAFTACDCFSPSPSNEFEISEAQLRAEIQSLFGAVLGAASVP